MTKWSIVDHLKLEMLVHRHRNLVASGHKRAEDDANRKLLKSTSTETEGREERLKAWSASKWEQLVKIDKRLSRIDLVRHVPLFTCSVALVLAVLTWLPHFDEAMTRAESHPMVINVSLFLAVFVLLPFSVFVFFLVSSLIRSTKHNVIRPLMDFCKRAIRGAQKANTQIHNIHARGSKEDRNASLYQPILWAYTCCVKTVFSGFRSKRTKLRDDSGPETHLPIGEALSQALMQQRSTLRLWSQRNIHLFGATYFSVFLLLFFLFLASDIPVFKSGIDGSQGEISEKNRFTMIGTPLSGFIDLPTTEQLSSAKLDSDHSQDEHLDAPYNWKAYLMLAIIAYVILPRSVLIAIQSLWLRHKLNSPDFRSLRYESLIRGMTEPAFLPESGPEGPLVPDLDPQSVSDPRSGEIRCCVIADCSLVEGSFRDGFSSFLNKRFEVEQDSSTVWMALDSTPLSGEQFKEQLNELLKPMLPLHASDRILHLVDSGQPPKSNYKTRTNRIREVVGPEAGIIYMLIHGNIELADNGNDSEPFRVWTQVTRSWKDANLEVESFNMKGQQL